MKPEVRRVDRAGADQRERVELEAKNGFLRGYVEGHDVDFLRKPWQYRKTSTKGTINIGCHFGFPNGRIKYHKAIAIV